MERIYHYAIDIVAHYQRTSENSRGWCPGSTFDTALINMHEACKALSKITATHHSAPSEGEGCIASRPFLIGGSARAITIELCDNYLM